MKSVFNFILKFISIIFWSIFIYLMFILAVSVIALISNYDALSSNPNISMPAVLGKALSPGFTALFVYAIAYFTWKWSEGNNNDLSLFDKIKTSLSIMLGRGN